MFSLLMFIYFLTSSFYIYLISLLTFLVCSVFSVLPEDSVGIFNSSLMLHCTVFDSGLKAPLSVKWKRDAGGLDSTIHQLANGSLFFPHLKEEDFGNYSCSAKRGNKQIQINVMVSKACMYIALVIILMN